MCLKKERRCWYVPFVVCHDGCVRLVVVVVPVRPLFIPHTLSERLRYSARDSCKLHLGSLRKTNRAYMICSFHFTVALPLKKVASWDRYPLVSSFRQMVDDCVVGCARAIVYNVCKVEPSYCCVRVEVIVHSLQKYLKNHEQYSNSKSLEW